MTDRARRRRAPESIKMNQPTREATLRSRFAQADWLAPELAQLRELRRLEQHPFLQRWFAGELTPGDLQIFSAEHHHAVVVLEDVARQAAALTEGLLGDQLVGYAEAQGESVQLSCEFATATGWGRSAWYFACDPLPQTLACDRAWGGAHGSLAERLMTIQAIESELSLLAPRQLDALVGRYGFDARSARYFVRRAERSARDAALGEAALTSLLPVVSPDALVRHAEMCQSAYWELLDGVQVLSQRS
jgi:pyrroloquinoline quinone (PQQ) biosynthesis protein C